MNELEFEYPEIREDFRPRDPLEAAARFVFDRYGYDFYFDPDDPMCIQVVEPNKVYKVRVSVKRPILITNYKTGKEKRLTLSLNNVLEVSIEKKGTRDFAVYGPRFNSIKSIIIEVIHKKIDILYERLFLQLEELKEKIAKPIFVRSQLNPIVNVLRDLYTEREINRAKYENKLGAVELLQKAGYLVKYAGKIMATEKANGLIDKYDEGRDFVYYVLGDLILNYQNELDKKKLYTYRPYLKMTVIYYKKAHLYSLNGGEISEDEILRELKRSLIDEYVREYNVPVNSYKIANLTTYIEHLIEDEILNEDEMDDKLLFGHKSILLELIRHNPLGGLEDVKISYLV